MINIVLVSHGELGDALIQAAEMIAGPAERVFSVPLLPGESPEGFGEKLSNAMGAIEGEETFVLVDLFGGTPYNAVARLVPRDNVECVTGANLPMLLELLIARDGASLSDLAASVTKVGQGSIKNLGPILSGRKQGLDSL